MAELYKIKLRYNPKVTPEFIEQVAKKNFPECKTKQHWGIPARYVFVRQNSFVQANIMVLHNASKDRTKIRITMGMKPTTITLLIILFGFGALIGIIIHYVKRGDFGQQVEDAIRDGLRDQLGIEW